MKAILQRDRAASKLVTFGKLYLPWIRFHPDLYTIELPWKDNAAFISCIPAGTYTLKPYSSPNKAKKSKQNVWEYQNVPRRSKCLIHAANFACDTTWNGKHYKNELLGCTAVGFGIDEDVPMITRSAEAMDYLRTTLGVNTTLQIEVRD